MHHIDIFLRVDATPDYKFYTIEHIAPQSPIKGSQVSSESIGMFGNLMFVHEDVNNKLKKKDFPEKKRILTSNKVPLDNVLKNSRKWNDETIKERTKHLADLCYNKIFKF